jgi:hypothetical protein
MLVENNNTDNKEIMLFTVLLNNKALFIYHVSGSHTQFCKWLITALSKH